MLTPRGIDLNKRICIRQTTSEGSDVCGGDVSVELDDPKHGARLPHVVLSVEPIPCGCSKCDCPKSINGREFEIKASFSVGLRVS